MQERQERGLDLHKGGGQDGMTGNQDDIPTRRNVWQMLPNGAAQHSLGPVTLNSSSDRAPCRHPTANQLSLVWQCNQDQQRVGIRFTLLPHALEIGGTRQTKLAVHIPAQELEA